MLPSTVVLCQGDDDHGKVTVTVPKMAQCLHQRWHHAQLFPQGVTVFRTIPIPAKMLNHLDILGLRKGSKVVWLTLLMDRRLNGRSCRRKGVKKTSIQPPATQPHLEPNYHRLPRDLDTMAFVGNLMVVLSLDGGLILPMTGHIYEALLELEEESSSTYNNDDEYDGMCCDDSDYLDVCTMEQSLSSLNDVADDDLCDHSLRRLTLNEDGDTLTNIQCIQNGFRSAPIRPVF